MRKSHDVRSTFKNNKRSNQEAQIQTDDAFNSPGANAGDTLDRY